MWYDMISQMSNKIIASTFNLPKARKKTLPTLCSQIKIALWTLKTPKLPPKFPWELPQWPSMLREVTRLLSEGTLQPMSLENGLSLPDCQNEPEPTRICDIQKVTCSKHQTIRPSFARFHNIILRCYITIWCINHVTSWSHAHFVPVFCLASVLSLSS